MTDHVPIKSSRRAGPIGAAAEPLVPEETTRPEPGALLADLIDLRGGVYLAEQLADLDRVGQALLTVAPEAVRRRMDDGLRHLESRLADAFTNAFKARYGLPDGARALILLQEAGAIEVRSGPALKAGTRAIYGLYGSFLETHLKRARFALRDLRVEMCALLPGLSDDAARLTHLAEALHEATARRTVALYARVPSSFERRFSVELKQAISALPETPCAEDLAPGFGPGGWLRRWMGQAEAMVYGVIQHERRLLEALVEACCETASQPSEA